MTPQKPNSSSMASDTVLRLGTEATVNMKSPNLKLECSTQQDIWAKIMKEVEAKRYAGPFEKIPFNHFIQLPIGLVPKSNGDVRLISHLSHPSRGNRSVNACTPKTLCSVKYKDLPYAIKLCLEAGRGCHTAKVDMKSAFRNLPIKPEDWMLLVMMAPLPITGKIYYFVDKCLLFGTSISCSHFQCFSNCVALLCQKRSGKKTNNYLDDFLFAALIKAMCDGQVEIFIKLCDEINFPIAPEKMVWGTTIIVFFRHPYQHPYQTISIPMEKRERALDQLQAVLNARTVMVLQLQKFTGLFNFLAQTIVPGRTSTRRMYAKFA